MFSIFKKQDEPFSKKKQIVFPGLISRLSATSIDLLIINFIFYFPMNFLSRNFIKLYFKSDLIRHNIYDITNFNNLNTSYPDFINDPVILHKYTIFFLTNLLIQALVISIYFIFFWSKYSKTPGKFLFNMKLVSIHDMQKPGIKNCIIRIISSVFFILGIWSIVFNKNRQSFHDKMAGTIVIKS